MPLAMLVAVAALAPATAIAQSGASAQPRIVGGNTASISTYPWQVGVVYSSAQLPSRNAQQREICGGELITSRIVMTAGHCVAASDPDCGPEALQGKPPLCTPISDPGGDGTAMIDSNDLDVVLGRSTLTNTSEGAEVGVQAVKLGTSFDGDFQGDGFPASTRRTSVRLASGQTPIKIAGTDEGALWDADSAEEISGWESTGEFGSPVYTLCAASVNVVPDSTCSGDYGIDFDAGTMVCAGFQTGGVDTCFGDSGVPSRHRSRGAAIGWSVSRVGAGVRRGRLPGRLHAVWGPTSGRRSPPTSRASAFPPPTVFGSGGSAPRVELDPGIRGQATAPRGARSANASTTARTGAAEEGPAHPDLNCSRPPW